MFVLLKYTIKSGFQTYLVDEIRKSCMCSKCEIGICKKLWLGKIQKSTELEALSFMDLFVVKTDCGYWNRYVNSATNIYKIAYNAINNKERSNYLSRRNRSYNLSTGLDESVKPKITCSVKGNPC